MMKKRTTAGRAAAIFAALFILASCQDSKDFNIQAGNLVKYTGAATKVRIPSSVTSIGSSAFAGLRGLTSVTIPTSVKSIGNGAFQGCTGLTSITIPSSVTEIEMYAFDDCTSLTNVTISSGVKSIKYATFGECEGLISITIPSSVTEIQTSAFEGCTSLTSVTIPSSVKSIGDFAFGKTALTSITIGAGVSLFNIEIDPFYGVGDFYDVYNRNGKQAGTYVRTGDNWVKR